MYHHSFWMIRNNYLWLINTRKTENKKQKFAQKFFKTGLSISDTLRYIIQIKQNKLQRQTVLF